MKNKTATIFGGTGFLGTQIVRELGKRGVTVKVATRVPESAYFLRPCGTVGQIIPFACDYSEGAIANAVKDSDFVINCIGILFEKGKKNRFQRLHAELPGVIAAAVKKAGVKNFIHISALGIDKSRSKYARTKLAGEHAVQENFADATILRPSVIFGEGDNFFNMFAHLSRFTPALPLIGGGTTKFQPVFVGDVADAVIAAIEQPAAKGKIYELGGSETVTFREIYELLFKYTNRPRALVSLPFFAAKAQAGVLSLLPKPLLTPDQVESLKTDNVVDKKSLGLADLGIKPTALELILPRYLKTYQSGGGRAARK